VGVGRIPLFFFPSFLLESFSFSPLPFLFSVVYLPKVTLTSWFHALNLRIGWAVVTAYSLPSEKPLLPWSLFFFLPVFCCRVFGLLFSPSKWFGLFFFPPRFVPFLFRRFFLLESLLFTFFFLGGMPRFYDSEAVYPRPRLGGFFAFFQTVSLFVIPRDVSPLSLVALLCFRFQPNF